MENPKIILGSHVGMHGKEMFAGSVKEALSYGANTFMVYTGAPQNTRRKELNQLNIEAGHALMEQNGIKEFIVHAPYIINPANSVNPATFELATEFLRLELDRSAAMGSRVLVLHPGSHIWEGRQRTSGESGLPYIKKGIRKIAECLNMVLNDRPPCMIALETMAGKGSEIGSSFEELAEIYDHVSQNHLLRVCLDTCHLHDAGYNIAEDFDGVLQSFDRILGLSQIAAVHVNDSKNPRGARKDRHANIGEGYIGYQALHHVVHHPALVHIPKILETPYRSLPETPSKTAPPYKEEIAWLLQP